VDFSYKRSRKLKRVRVTGSGERYSAAEREWRTEYRMAERQLRSEATATHAPLHGAVARVRRRDGRPWLGAALPRRTDSRRRRRAGSECRQRGARHAAGERRRRRPPRTRRSSRTLHSLSLSLSLGVHCSSSSRPVERSLGCLIYHMPGYRTNGGRTTRGAAAFRTWHSWVLSHSLTSWYLMVDS